MAGKIIVLRGVPASGKSTYAKKLHEKDPRYVIVSRDAIREARGTYWIRGQESYITEVEAASVEAALRCGLIPVIDATNLNPGTQERWRRLANEHQAELEYVDFDISVGEALKRDTSRERPVGRKAMMRFFWKYKPEAAREYFTDQRIKDGSREFRHTGLPEAVLCDLDGTLSLLDGRDPYSYSMVKEDIPNGRLVEILKALMSQGIKIVFISGRDDSCAGLSKEWIAELSGLRLDCDDIELHMRATGDMRPDPEVKREIYLNEIVPKYNVIGCFDDRDSVVEMWRGLGLLCMQVYPGDF